MLPITATSQLDSGAYRLSGLPAFNRNLADARLTVHARLASGTVTGPTAFQDTPAPCTGLVLSGITSPDETVRVRGWLGIPRMTSPDTGARLPSDRTVRVAIEGSSPDLLLFTMLATAPTPTPAAPVDPVKEVEDWRATGAATECQHCHMRGTTQHVTLGAPAKDAVAAHHCLGRHDDTEATGLTLTTNGGSTTVGPLTGSWITPAGTTLALTDDQGSLRAVESCDVNEYLARASGGDFTAKDFRTWHATVIFAAALAAAPPATTKTARAKVVRTAVGHPVQVEVKADGRAIGTMSLRQFLCRSPK